MLYVEEVSGILYTSCDFVNKYVTRLLCYYVQMVYIHTVSAGVTYVLKYKLGTPELFNNLSTHCTVIILLEISIKYLLTYKV